MSNTKPNSSQITYDTGVNKQDLNSILDTVVPIADYAALRAYSGRATQIRITDPGISGFFYYDAIDTTSVDNDGTVIVSGTKRWKRVFDGSVNVKWFGAKGDGSVPDESVAINAAIAATKKEDPSGYLLPIAGSALCIPPGTYNISSTIELHDADNYLIDADRAEFIYSGVDKAFHVARCNYCIVRGLQIRLLNDGANCAAMYLQASRWNTFENLILSGTRNPVTPQELSVGLYLFGGPSDTNDNLYNRFKGVTFRHCGWSIVLDNTDNLVGAFTRSNANWFEKLTCNSQNGIRIVGSSGNYFQASMEAKGTQISLETSVSGVAASDNQFDFVWYEVATSTWRIDARCDRNRFSVQYDNNNNFPDYNVMPNAKYQIVNAPLWQQYTSRSSERYLFTPSGEFVISRADSAYTPEAGFRFQCEYDMKLGASGANNNHRVHVGTNGQFVIAQDGGQGGLSLMGPSNQSSACAVFGNNYMTAPTEKWRQWLDGSNNTLNFGYGNTWKSVATNISVQYTAAVSANETCMLLLVNNGTTTALRRVSVGAADSAGTGFRALRVPN